MTRVLAELGPRLSRIPKADYHERIAEGLHQYERSNKSLHMVLFPVRLAAND
jgi:hypothetical protein